MAKRLFDMSVSAVALLLLALPMLLIAFWIRLDSPGPALYRQERVGRHGQPFRIHKFRTMHLRTGEDLPITADGDARITRAGRWLRGRRLDELPQLWNVLSGQMSLVGPRPEVDRYVQQVPADLRAIVLSVRPGVTDPAALAHRHEGEILARARDPEQCYLQDILPNKVRMQADYIRRATLLTDLQVLAKTATVLFTR
jgi:lipopolysaccharide/colanic/teichoic acid biosynthesis glycosyltransferase